MSMELEDTIYEDIQSVHNKLERADEDVQDKSYYMSLSLADLQESSNMETRYTTASPCLVRARVAPERRKDSVSISSHCMHDLEPQQHNMECYHSGGTGDETVLMDVATEILAEVKNVNVRHRNELPTVNEKRHARNRFIFCLVILSNVLSLAALVVAVTWIVFWIFEIRGYGNKMDENLELLNELIEKIDALR